MKLNLKKDWWFANSLYWILSGLFIVVTRLLEGTGSAVGILIFSGGLNILIGVALLQRIKLIFWITLVFAILTFLGQLSNMAQVSKEIGGLSLTVPFGMSLVPLALALMLWQQIRKESL
ncbi:MAG: hypothetical protein ABIB98_03000 [bacterium]